MNDNGRVMINTNYQYSNSKNEEFFSFIPSIKKNIKKKIRQTDSLNGKTQRFSLVGSQRPLRPLIWAGSVLSGWYVGDRKYLQPQGPMVALTGADPYLSRRFC